MGYNLYKPLPALPYCYCS